MILCDDEERRLIIFDSKKKKLFEHPFWLPKKSTSATVRIINRDIGVVLTQRSARTDCCCCKLATPTTYRHKIPNNTKYTREFGVPVWVAALRQEELQHLKL